jgi:hypothetical protein
MAIRDEEAGERLRGGNVGIDDEQLRRGGG